MTPLNLSTPLLAAADWVQLVAVVLFFLISGVVQLIQKRAAEKRRLYNPNQPRVPEAPVLQHGSPPPPVHEPAPIGRDSWEDQLRRLLDGEPLEEPVSRPVAPPVSPPVLPPSSSPPTPARLQPTFDEEPVPLESREIPASSDDWAGMGGARLNTAAKLAGAAAAYREASNLRTIIENRLRAARARSEEKASLARQGRRPKAAPALELFRKPDTVRTAIIASTILQPPKALE